MMAYGANPVAEFPPKRRDPAPSGIQAEAGAAFCVRTCDGRYYPAQSGTMQSTAESCKNLCPASETKVFSGSSIEHAYSRDGKPYSALTNAFRYRKEIVSDCTCNGKDPVGLASISVKEDKTLRRGDLVVTEAGLQVTNRVEDGHLSFVKAPASTRMKYERLPVLASE